MVGKEKESALTRARSRRFEMCEDDLSVSTEIFDKLYSHFETSEETLLQKSEVLALIGQRVEAIDGSLDLCRQKAAAGSKVLETYHHLRRSRDLNDRLRKVILGLSEIGVSTLLERVQLRLLEKVDQEIDDTALIEAPWS